MNTPMLVAVLSLRFLTAIAAQDEAPPRPPAFPGAQGGGALSKGGRGGSVLPVTNVNDAGEGSLRACVEARGPRTCVFRTGGTIALQSSLSIDNPFITIAGQTAPGGGIQLKGPAVASRAALVISTHDVVVQYLRVRRGHYEGEVCNAMPWSCGASVQISSLWPDADPSNIMLDHVSMEWSNFDAMIALGSNQATLQPRSVTVSRSILGEALGGAGQAVGVNFGGFSGAGPKAPDGMTDLDLHHNLFAGSSHRMPLLTVKSARLVNNVVHGWTYYAMRSKGLRDFVNNEFKLRSGQQAASHEIQAWTEDAGNDTSSPPSFYLAGNIGPNDPAGTANWSMTGLARDESGAEALSPLPAMYQRSAPIPTPPGYVPIVADPTPFSPALLNAGRAPPFEGVGASRRIDCNGSWVDALDPVDSRIVTAVANAANLFGAYDYTSLHASPPSQTELGGWPALAAGTPCDDADGDGMPDAWESYWAGALGSGTSLLPGGSDFGDGYTNLEHYLHGMNPRP